MRGEAPFARVRQGVSFHGRINTMDVVVVIQRAEESGDLLSLRVRQSNEVLRDVAQLGGGQLPAGLREEFGDSVEVFDFDDETSANVTFGNFLRLERLHILRASLNRVPFRVARLVRVRGLNHARMIKEKTDAAGRAERTGAKKMTDFGCGPIAIVGETLDNHGN